MLASTKGKKGKRDIHLYSLSKGRETGVCESCMEEMAEEPALSEIYFFLIETSKNRHIMDGNDNRQHQPPGKQSFLCCKDTPGSCHLWHLWTSDSVLHSHSHMALP